MRVTLSRPISTAIVRNNRWWASQRSPSTISARIDRVDRTRESVAAARKSPPISATSTALRAYVTALTRNGLPAESANRNPPSGPASIPFMRVVPPPSQPLARSRRCRGTTVGNIAWLAERNTISPVLTTNSTTYSSTTPARPLMIAVARTASATTRTRSMMIIRRRRSIRSTSTPPGRANSNHGSQATADAAATTSGSSVREATNSGAATVASPLPRAERVLAAQRRANTVPRPAVVLSCVTASEPISASPASTRIYPSGRSPIGRAVGSPAGPGQPTPYLAIDPAATARAERTSIGAPVPVGPSGPFRSSPRLRVDT